MFVILCAISNKIGEWKNSTSPKSVIFIFILWIGSNNVDLNIPE